MADPIKDLDTLESIKNMTEEEIQSYIDFIQASEKLIGENDKGIPPVLSRPLKDFISLFKTQMSLLASEMENIGAQTLLTQERVDELMNVTDKVDCSTTN